MTIETEEQQSADLDSIDKFLSEWNEDVPELDFEVEGIVDRIYTLAKRLRQSADETFAAYGLNHGEWKALLALRRTGPPYRRSPGWLAEHLCLSSGAMTNRLDRLEQAGLVRRLPDPKDRRANRLFLTASGRQLVDDLDSLRDAIATDVIHDMPAETVQTTLHALRDIKDRIKSLSDHNGHIAAK